MTRTLTFVAQLVGLSALLSLAVKYGAPRLPELPPTLPIVLLMISFPTLAVSLLLLWLQQRPDRPQMPFQDRDELMGSSQDRDG